MKRYFRPLMLLALMTGCLSTTQNWILLETPASLQRQDPFLKQIRTLLAEYRPDAPYPEIAITYPYGNALFPPEISAPTVTWQDPSPRATQWLLIISFADSAQTLYALSNENHWQPDPNVWEKIKEYSQKSKATITITGVIQNKSPQIVSSGRVGFATSRDPINAAILFRQVPLPFSKDFKKVKWRLGDVASYQKPKVIMKNLGVCASCHGVSRDGKYISMEMNYGNDGGAQFIKKIEKKIVLKGNDFFSWNTYPRGGIIPRTRGLFGKMSPSGRYAIASVNEISLALITNNPGFSQVFFPTYGILAYYSSTANTFKPIPGANDYAYVHANPNWRHDEQRIVFARAKTKNEVHDDLLDTAPKYKDADIHELNRQYNIQFDLYTIPFNNGQGGIPKPLPGASHNGMSNYFARYSPNGEWIVFTQSKTGIMLQPDSTLYIIPAEGGHARRMNCNRALYNSWHSWSPNGKWLLFSSKVNTIFTEIFVTHIDENGDDSPPVLLSRFSDSQYAANVPEFVNISADAIDSITVQ